jgi:predicted Zn-dependent protease
MRLQLHLTASLAHLAAGLALAIGLSGVMAPAAVAKSKANQDPQARAQAEWEKRRVSYLKGAPKDRALGSREHPNLLKEFGGTYNDDRVSGYVASIGGKMVSNSEVPTEPFTFTLLNSKVVNAFALPGGYVYISRQLLGLMNDEAELASVLGHETGHVTDRHTDKRMKKARNVGLGQILLVLGGAVTGSEMLGQLGQVVGQQGQLWVLGYSRDQEFAADSLGVNYMTRAGYDPYGAADMLSTLGAQTALDARILGRDADKVPTMARTHPQSAERVARASSIASATGIAARTRPRNRDAFLATIDGLAMDDDADQGFVRGRTFMHPKLMIGFSVPEGFALDNGNDAVQIIGTSGAGGMFSGGALGQNESLDSYIGKAWQGLAGQNAPALAAARQNRINGMESATTSTTVAQNNGTQLSVTITAYRFSPTNGYHFIFISPATGQTPQAYDTIANSFRKISAPEAAQLKERRISVVTVKSGDTAQSMAQRMAYDTYQLERFLTLNGMSGNQDMQSGQKVKLVVYRP